MHEMQTILTVDRGVCLSVCQAAQIGGGECSVRRVPYARGHSVQSLSNYFDHLLFCRLVKFYKSSAVCCSNKALDCSKKVGKQYFLHYWSPTCIVFSCVFSLFHNFFVGFLCRKIRHPRIYCQDFDDKVASSLCFVACALSTTPGSEKLGGLYVEINYLRASCAASRCCSGRRLSVRPSAENLESY